jgi:hypothetical protein
MIKFKNFLKIAFVKYLRLSFLKIENLLIENYFKI